MAVLFPSTKLSFTHLCLLHAREIGSEQLWDTAARERHINRMTQQIDDDDVMLEHF